MFVSFYQGSIIMILITLMLGKESFYMVTTVSFTCLIFIEFLNVFIEVNLSFNSAESDPLCPNY